MNKFDKDFFVISKRILVALSAAFFVFMAIAFLTGYFWGKHAALEDLVRVMEQRSLGNQVAASLYSFALPQNNNDTTKENEGTEQESFVIESPVLEVEQPSTDTAVANVEISTENSPSVSVTQEAEMGYCAQLIGFSSKKAAYAFAERLEHVIPLNIKQRTSVSSRGHKKNWYQVVTTAYKTKDALQQAIDPIVRKEKLNGIIILQCVMEKHAQEGQSL